MGRFRAGTAVGSLAAATALVGVATAHGVALRSGGRALDVPPWLFVVTGGGVVGASFLLASLATDRAFLAGFHGWRAVVGVPRAPLAWAGRLAGLAALAVVLLAGAFGPASPTQNAAVLLVWVGWWAGLAMVAYLVVDLWSVLDPARALARPLPDGLLEYPDRLGAWPSVAGLLALVYAEVVTRLAESPPVLGTAVAAYVALAVTGAVAVGAETWFGRVDPVARVFSMYGRVAPLQRTDGGLALVPPGSELVSRPVESDADVAFVVALLWGTTFDGLVATPGWADAVRGLLGAGVPPRLLYLAALLGGFALFAGGYLASVRLARRTAPTYVTADALARRFAASLLPIAAGYHLAHYLDYFVSLSPALFATLRTPLSATRTVAFVLPSWFGGVALAAVLLGHLLAVWVAHGVAFETFPGRLQAVRSQYPLTAVMVAYTMTSLWVVTRPSAVPPGL